jgi:putative transposase
MLKKKRKKREKVIIRLTKKDKEFLINFLNKGTGKARQFKRARILLKLDEGVSTTIIAEDVNYYPLAVRQIGKRYKEGGINQALYDKQRPGKKRALTEKQSSQIIAMVCSPAPEGRARWTIRLIAEEAKKRKIVEKIERESIRILLKTHDLKPWREKNVVRS